MSEKENRYAAKLVNRLIKLSSLSVTINPDDVDETLQDWDTKESGLHVFIGKMRGDDAISLEQMSMDEYKYYINKKIFDTPIQTSNKRGSYTIQVTREGLLRMKEDYEYEQYVLETIGNVLGQPMDSPFSDHFLLFFTDKKEENYGMCCGSIDNVREYKNMNIQDYDSKSGNEDDKEESDRKRNEGRKRVDIRKEREKRQNEYYDMREGKKPRPGKSPINPSQIARMYYAYNIAPK